MVKESGVMDNAIDIIDVRLDDHFVVGGGGVDFVDIEVVGEDLPVH
jgi:hypothetical protein